jgi:hypothetical protein
MRQHPQVVLGDLRDCTGWAVAGQTRNHLDAHDPSRGPDRPDEASGDVVGAADVALFRIALASPFSAPAAPKHAQGARELRGAQTNRDPFT